MPGLPHGHRSDATHLGRSLVHALRLTVAGLFSGMFAGAVAGLGSRLAMFMIRLMNPSHNGEVTHANSVVGQFTLAGTMALVTEGMFLGVSGAVVYLVVRRWMPGRGVVKGLAFGVFLLVLGAPLVLDDNYEYVRYVSPWIGLTLFALLYPLYGLVVSPLTEALGGGTPGPPRSRWLARSGSLLLGAALLLSLVKNLAALRWNWS